VTKTVAALVVDNPTVFQWLGHMPVLNWSLRQLREVRGVDAVVCVAPKPLQARAHKLLAPEGIEVTRLPDSVSKDDALEAWIVSAAGPAADAEAVVLLRPSVPFLPAGKIEACLHQVRRGLCAACAPAVEVARSRGKNPPVLTVSPVRSLKVFAPGRVCETALKTVPVSLIESLDVLLPDAYTVADALVSGSYI
jgi:hypothetical protein